MNQYLLAHDLGTSGDKAVLYSLDGQPVAEQTSHYDSSYPFERAVEQNPQDWWNAFCVSTKALLERSGVQPSEVAAVSFSAQMNSCLPVDVQGTPLRPAMIWADQRGGEQADRLVSAFGADKLYALTGQLVNASYGVCKMSWFRQHEPELYARTAKFLQPKDYLSCCLTGQMVTDYSDASHLACFDQGAMEWSRQILEVAGLDLDKMPQMLPSTDVAGKVTAKAAAQCGLLEGTPVVVGGGDGCCATAGAGVHRPGQAYNSLGTSSWIGTLTAQPVIDPMKRTFNLIHLDGKHHLALGTTQSAGFSLQWAIDTLYGREEADGVFARLAEITASVPTGSKGLYFLPYLLGERSPWWNPNATGCFIGLTAQHGKPEMLKSVMEGVGLNLRLILDSLASQASFNEMRIIGGGAKNDVWLQILADIWQTTIRVPRLLEYATSAGAALCAGVGVGAFNDLSAAEHINPVEREVTPRAQYAGAYDEILARFTALYKALEPVAFAG